MVGGAVRDELLGIPVKDIDIEVHGISSHALKRSVESHFRNVQEVGAAFGVLHTNIDGYEVDISLPRKDSKVGPGHKGFDVDVDPNMSVEDALRRRDFTVNAMLKDILSGQIIDPFHGRDDLDARVLRPVDPATFIEDPLRVLRAVQLTARFALSVSNDVKALLHSMMPHVAELSRDRCREEWRKLFVKAARPSLGLHLAYDIGVFHTLPIVEAMKRTVQEPEWHPEGDVWTHTCMVCDEAAAIATRDALHETERLLLLLAAFCHDLGKPKTTRVVEGRVRAFEHSRAGLECTQDVLRFFGFEACGDMIRPLVEHHLEPFMLYYQTQTESPPGDGAIRALARRMHPATIEQLLRVAEADMRGRGPVSEQEKQKLDAIEWVRQRAHELHVRDQKPADVIRGNDLLAFGMKPGPHFGVIVRAANMLHDEDHLEKPELLARIRRQADALQQVRVVEEAVAQLRTSKGQS